MSCLFRIMAQVHRSALHRRDHSGNPSREEDGGFDEGGTHVAQSALVQEQRFQLLGFTIGQQQRIIFAERPSFMRPRPGARIPCDTSWAALDLHQIDCAAPPLTDRLR